MPIPTAGFRARKPINESIALSATTIPQALFPQRVFLSAMLPLAMDFAALLFFFDLLFALALSLWISLSFAISVLFASLAAEHGRYFASRQLSPTPTSTSNGTSSR